MKHMIVSSSLLSLFLLISACGGGGEEEQSFVTRPVPSEYAGLSMAELKAKSNTPAYIDLRDNIDNFNGDLVWFSGQISKVFQGSEPNSFQIYVDVTHITESTDTKVDTWRDPLSGSVLLLYSLDRGPELHEGNIVQFAGTVHGIFTPQIRRFADQSAAQVFNLPVISVIKAEPVSESSD